MKSDDYKKRVIRNIMNKVNNEVRLNNIFNCFADMIREEERKEIFLQQLDEFGERIQESKKFLKENNAKAEKIFNELIECF